MSAKDKSLKDKKMAADLKKRGIFHGKRLSSPYPNSGGTTMTWGAGSSKNQRREASSRRGPLPGSDSDQ